MKKNLYIVLTGKSFQTLIIRCVKKDDLALMVHCGYLYTIPRATVIPSELLLKF